MTIAFYAPLKSPTHPVPSGDRHMARLLIKALQHAGFKTDLASDFRSFNKKGDLDIQLALEKEAAKEVERLIARYEKEGPPEIWFTYHLYHKAPDLIGPKIARHFHLPYCLAEASYAPKQRGGKWDRGLALSEEALNLAGRIYTLNPDDMACIRPHLSGWAEIIPLPPFLDPAPYQSSLDQLSREKWANQLDLPMDDIWAVAVGMMREGDKTQSYEILAESWQILGDKACPLILVGDGINRQKLQILFANKSIYPIRFTGEMNKEDIADLLQNCDLFVWPGINEAFGLAMMEAQAAGLPVISANRAGIAGFIHDQKTGLLVSEGDAEAFAKAVERLLQDENLSHNMSHAAEMNINQNHSLTSAARILHQSLPL